MADKSLSTIASELWQGFGNNPRNVETFDTLANVFPPAMLYRGAKTLANTDFGTIKDALMGKYQISQTPRQDLQRAGQAITDLGFGAMDVAPAFPLVKPALKAAAPIAARQAVNMAERYGVSPTMNIVKPEGPSNWLPGSIEESTRRLKRSPARVEELTGAQIQERGLGDIWKELHEGPNMHLGTYDKMRYLVEKYPDKLTEFGYKYSPQDTAINTWIDRRLNPYIRNEMATPNDPVRAMAEQGRLHYTPELFDHYNDKAAFRREQAGFPVEGSGVSDLARQWETLTDTHIQSEPVKKWLENADPAVLEKMPWIKHLGPDDLIYERTTPGFHGLGFDHMVDELMNATSPESTLPDHLRLTTKQLEQMSVPRAAEHVANINQWRATETLRAEKQGYKAHLSAPPSHVDESFELSFVDEPGGKWVDIPETIDEKGLGLCTSIGKAGGWCTQGKSTAKQYGSGENRLVALLDAEGRPHVQATIRQIDIPENASTVDEVLFNRLINEGQEPSQAKDIVNRINEQDPEVFDYYFDRGIDLQEYIDEAEQALHDTANQIERLPSITELKPVSNSLTSDRALEYAKRDPAYAEKIAQSTANFLNSKKFGKLPAEDLEKMGLVDLYNTDTQAGWPSVDLDAVILAFENAPDDLPRIMTNRQFKQFLEPYADAPRIVLPDTPTQAFAAGGLVSSDYDEEHIDKLSDALLGGEYGLRETGEAKGKGALGEIRMPDGRDVMTEYSVNVDGREMPSIVEGMHPADVNYIRETGIVPEDAIATAIRSANKREAEGKSAFFAKGGNVNKDKIDKLAAEYFKKDPTFAKRVSEINYDLDKNGKYSPSKYGMNITSMPGNYTLGVDPNIIRTGQMSPSDVAVTTTSRNPFSKPVQEMVFNISRGDQALPTLAHEASHAWDATNRSWLKKRGLSEKEANAAVQRYMSVAPKLKAAGDLYADYTFDDQATEDEVVAKLRAYESILPAGAKIFQTKLGKQVFPTDEAKAWWLSRTQPSMSDQNYIEWATKQAKQGKYAEGGLVYNDEEINNLANQLFGA